MKLIVNVDKQWNIGCDNELLFPIPEDMKFFRQTTTGKVIVMGRKTLDSFPGGRPLKNRINIVLTRDKSFKREGTIVCNSIEEVLDLIKEYNSDDVYIIGGESVYKAFLGLCDTAIVTHVDAIADRADKKFPVLSSLPEWKLSFESEIKEDAGYKFRFCEYIKI